MPNQTVTIFDYPLDRLPIEMQCDITYYGTPILDTANRLNTYTVDDFKDVRMPAKAENDHRLIVVSEPKDGAEFSETVSHIILELTHYGVPFIFVQVPLDSETRTVQKNPLICRTYESIVRFDMKKYGVIPEQFETVELPPLSCSLNELEVGDSYEQCLLVSTCSKQGLHLFSRLSP